MKTLLGRSLAFVAILTMGACSLAVDLSSLDEGCGTGRKVCDDECVSSEEPETGCAREGCQPCALPHATPVCSNDGACAIAACIGSWEDCDKKTDTGCEVDLDTDLEHCGACDARPCMVANAEPACGSGSCAIRRCNPGFNDCDRRSSNGCESNEMTDIRNCGACGSPCAAGQDCVNGECV